MWSVYAQRHTIPIFIITAKCLHVMKSYLNVIPFFSFTNLAEYKHCFSLLLGLGHHNLVLVLKHLILYHLIFQLNIHTDLC